MPVINRSKYITKNTLVSKRHSHYKNEKNNKKIIRKG